MLVNGAIDVDSLSGSFQDDEIRESYLVLKIFSHINLLVPFVIIVYYYIYIFTLRLKLL